MSHFPYNEKSKSVSNVVYLKNDLLKDFLVLEIFFFTGLVVPFFMIVLCPTFMTSSLQIYERLYKNHSSESMKVNIQLFTGLLLSF